MTEQEVRDSITLLAEATSAPVLATADLDFLVVQAKRADTAGLPPDDLAWVPTWNVAYAVSLGWRIKLGRLVASYDFASADQRLSRSQMWDHCKAMVEYWSGAGGVGLGGVVSGMGTIQLRGLPTRPLTAGDAPLEEWQIVNGPTTEDSIPPE